MARPGHSEHQLGTTLDITSQGLTDVDQSWGATPIGQWIATNAYHYGFILSYPQDAQSRTCYDYEPWHLRYVGKDMAAKVIASGLTLQAGVPVAARPPRAERGRDEHHDHLHHRRRPAGSGPQSDE